MARWKLAQDSRRPSRADRPRRRLLHAFYWHERTAAKTERAIIIRFAVAAAHLIAVAALCLALAISYHQDRVRLQGEIELAREAYSQLVSEQIAMRDHLDEIVRRAR